MTDRSRTTLSMGLLGLTSFFLFADQNLMAPNLSLIAQEFGFSDVEKDQKLGGEVAVWFWMLGGVVSLGVGWLTDRVNRRNLYALTLIIGALPCFLTGYARTYDELLLCRALTGIGIGGAIPLLYSLIGDLYPANKRGNATATIGFAMGLGIAMGQLLAGMLGPEHGWRLPFLIVGAPNFLLAFVFLAAVREPVRGQSEAAFAGGGAAEHGGKVRWSDYKEVFKARTAVLAFVQGIPGTVPWGVFFVFLNDFYSHDKGYSIQSATLLVMLIGGAAILGGFLGGLVGNRLYNRNPALLPLFCGATTLLGILPTAALLNYPAQSGPDASLTMPMIFGVLTGLLAAITGPNVRTILINVTAPETRGSVFSLYNLADDLGRGFGPAIIGVLVASFGRVTAFNVANLFWIFCGITLLYMARTFPADERALQARLAAKAGGA